MADKYAYSPGKVKNFDTAKKVVDTTDVESSTSDDITTPRVTGKVLDGFFCQYTGQAIQAYETDEITSDDDVDNVIYFKKDLTYYKRVCDHLEPEWFGAVSDGETDCTSSFQKCINTSVAQKMDIYCKDGTYLFSGSITWQTKGGPTVINKLALASKDAYDWQFNHIYGSTLGMTYFYYPNLSTDDNVFMYIYGVPGVNTNGFIKNVSFFGSTTTTAIQISGMTGFKIKDCSFYANKLGILLKNRASGEYTEFCVAEFCDFKSSCLQVLRYSLGQSGADASFHGSGLGNGCIINAPTNVSGAISVYVENGTYPYNSPLFCHYWNKSPYQILVYSENNESANSGIGFDHFYGNIQVETSFDNTSSTSLVIGSETLQVFKKYIGTIKFTGNVTGMGDWKVGDVMLLDGIEYAVPAYSGLRSGWADIHKSDNSYYMLTNTAYISGDVLKNLKTDNFGIYNATISIFEKSHMFGSNNQPIGYTANITIYHNWGYGYWGKSSQFSYPRIDIDNINTVSAYYNNTNYPIFYIDELGNFGIYFLKYETNYIKITSTISNSVVDTLIVPIISNRTIGDLLTRNNDRIAISDYGDWSGYGSGVVSVITVSSTRINGVKALNLNGIGAWNKGRLLAPNYIGNRIFFFRMYIKTQNSSTSARIGYWGVNQSSGSIGWIYSKTVPSAKDWILVSGTMSISNNYSEVMFYINSSGGTSSDVINIYQSECIYLEEGDTSDLYNMRAFLQRPILNIGSVDSLPSNNLYVFEDHYQLIGDGIGTDPGTYKVTATGTNITVGDLTYNGNYVSINSLSSISGSSANISYVVSGTKSDGTTFTITLSQTVNIVTTTNFITSDSPLITRDKINLMSASNLVLSTPSSSILGISISNDGSTYTSKYTSSSNETGTVYSIDNAIITPNISTTYRGREYNVNGKKI